MNIMSCLLNRKTNQTFFLNKDKHNKILSTQSKIEKQNYSVEQMLGIADHYKHSYLKKVPSANK